MGHDVCLVQASLAENFTCAICLMIYERPHKLQKCGHIFCWSCLDQWITSNTNCPICRTPTCGNEMTSEAYRPYSIMFGKMSMVRVIDNLDVYCRHRNRGCERIIKLRDLNRHASMCNHNPNRAPVSCAKGCGAKLRSHEISEHNCVTFLRGLVEAGNRERANIEAENKMLRRYVKNIPRHKMN